VLVYDTSVAILLRDGDEATLKRSQGVTGPVAISVITKVELEGGVYKLPALAIVRRERLDFIYRLFNVLPFETSHAAVYGQIVAAAGYSRRKVMDRMIAAQTLAHKATLVTTNPSDFADVPGLTVEGW
jgi:predicted nucleic acid-binding protein